MRMLASRLFFVIATVSAAPAIVWKKSNEHSPTGLVHSSNDISSEALLSELLKDTNKDSPLAAVFFLLGRGQGGNEHLSALASNGAIPNIATMQNSAHFIHHHVSGVQSGASLISDASRTGHNPLLVNLDEFSTKLTMLQDASEVVEISASGMMSKSVHAASKRARQLAKSNVLIVNIDADTDPKEIDSAVVRAIEHNSIQSVVLSAVRSVSEVKHERELKARQRYAIMAKAGSGIKNSNRRRLEEAQQGDDAANENQDNSADLSGIYYVSLTPNILAGILFFFLFTIITYTGVSCMGMIKGQDVFVSKMPDVGREA